MPVVPVASKASKKNMAAPMHHFFQTRRSGLGNIDMQRSQLAGWAAGTGVRAMRTEVV